MKQLRLLELAFDGASLNYKMKEGKRKAFPTNKLYQKKAEKAYTELQEIHKMIKDLGGK